MWRLTTMATAWGDQLNYYDEAIYGLGGCSEMPPAAEPDTTRGAPLQRVPQHSWGCIRCRIDFATASWPPSTGPTPPSRAIPRCSTPAWAIPPAPWSRLGHRAPGAGFPGFVSGGWSGRFTGEINLAAASNLSVAGNGLRSLWVDGATASSTTAIAAGRHRIMVEASGATTIALQSRPAGTGGFANVAGSTLIPRYDLVTRSITEDSIAAVAGG